MDKQYYIPEIEELFIGYECDVKDTDNNWHHCRAGKKITKTDIGINHLLSISQLGIRTKTLTKEDIESEGWKFQEIIKGTFGIQKYSHANNKIQGCDFDTWYTLKADFGYKEPNISIYTENVGGMIYTKSTECIFRGKCKSINELRKITQWLEIK